jgi:hypothetical protein
MICLRSAIVIMSSAVFPLFALDAGLMQFAAPDATEVAGVNVDRVSNSPLAASLIKRIGAGDVHEVVVFSQRGVGLIAARGVFDRALVAGKLKETYNGVELFAGPRGSDLVAFPEPTLALYGDLQTLKAALDRRGTTAVLDVNLGNKIRDLGARYDAWFAAKGTTGMSFGKTKLPAEAVEFVSGGLSFGAVIRLDAEAVMKTEKDAQSLVQLVKFLAGMGGTSRMGQVTQLLQNADAHAEGATVVFSTSASEADLEKLLGGSRRKTAALRQ